MKLTIKTLDQKNYQIETAGMRTVWDLKRRLFNSATTNLLPERQQLIYAGRVLKDKKLLSKYAIDERKFLLVMSRKPPKPKTASVINIKRADKNNNNAIRANNKKCKRVAETAKPHKANAGQGDGPDIGCAKKPKQSKDSKKFPNPKQIKRTKTTTTITGSKCVKMNMNKDALPSHAPKRKVKIMRKHKSTTSTGSSTQDEYTAKRHFPTSTSSMNSTDAPYAAVKSILRNGRGANRTRKCVRHRRRHTKEVEQGKCDELVLRQIVALGYNEEDVRRALIASFNDPNHAVEYLIEQLQDRIEQQALKKQNKQQQDEQHKDHQTQKHCCTMAKVKPKKSNALAFLRHDPDFQNLRRVLRDRPNILQTVLNRIGAAHPDLLGLLKEHEDDFLQLLHERSSDEDQSNSYMENKEMSITPEEEKIIARLVRMGFKRQMVILAFIACDRNVEKAVDYLCRIGDIQI